MATVSPIRRRSARPTQAAERQADGVLHRSKYLDTLLDHVIGHDEFFLMTASEIGDWDRDEMTKL
ncbi:hypothetical protein [Bradyrhizobium sp.]|uniref:hypothetical protein n=1 Tax=Bradyrhizobium sp. TaxID=376 RepID=UPI003C62DE55